MQFRFSAINSRGRTTRGTIEAISRDEAKNSLHSQGMFPLTVTPQKHIISSCIDMLTMCLYILFGISGITGAIIVLPMFIADPNPYVVTPCWSMFLLSIGASIYLIIHNAIALVKYIKWLW